MPGGRAGRSGQILTPVGEGRTETCYKKKKMVLPRDNPFRSECMERLPFRLPGLSWNDLIDRWRQLNGRGLLVGPEGHGKSTLLRAMSEWWVGEGHRSLWLRLTFRQRRLTPMQVQSLQQLPDEAAVWVDSMEQLDWWGWRQLRRLTCRLRGLVATSHRPGRLPTLLRCTTSVELLEQLVAELHPPHNRASPLSLAPLFASHRGNIRECLRALYDQCATS